jgi:hypothetical protein
MYLNEQQLPAVMRSVRMLFQVPHRSLCNLRKYLGPIPHLHGDDSPIARWRIPHYIREIAVEREKYCIQFLRLLDYLGIWRVGLKMVPKPKHLVPPGFKPPSYRLRHTVVGKKTH